MAHSTIQSVMYLDWTWLPTFAIGIYMIYYTGIGVFRPEFFAKFLKFLQKKIGRMINPPYGKFFLICYRTLLL